MADWQRLQARLPLLDQHQLQRMEGELRAEVLTRLLRLFVEDGRTQGEALEGAFAERDYALMARCCHSLKSACGSYGALRCQYLSEKLEQSCHERDDIQVENRMRAWQQALEETLQQLETRLNAG
ncbi:Hpt domain-containing protein [Oceanisphaera arctica]|uniref:Hpt domain-containing protein n=1 Tax=Oceanisphaera arctica TaxID=641510 RepID=A0A2P5TPW4_9GAMM|nr:Hpt domain-containing protein [Oceanisphaera arctica]PPL17746.1 Hpt domain-containing protein [Oceanisphaera arctica]GHA18218.1 histidine kinase [Oceanisphaera arctica]